MWMCIEDLGRLKEACEENPDWEEDGNYTRNERFSVVRQ